MNRFKADGRILTCTSHLHMGERQEPLLGEAAGSQSPAPLTGEEEEGPGDHERSPANTAGLFCSSGRGLLLRRMTWASCTCRKDGQGSPDTWRFPSSAQIHLTRGPWMLFSERLPGRGWASEQPAGDCTRFPPVGVSYGAQAYIRLYANVHTCVHRYRHRDVCVQCTCVCDSPSDLDRDFFFFIHK